MKTPKVIKYKNQIYYKKIRIYKYHTRPFTGYFGGYWKWEWNDKGELYKEWLFQVVELAYWQVERDMKEMLKHFKIEYE